MTVITGIAAGDMIRRLSGGPATVVATETGAHDVRMIDADYRRPPGGTMTAFTVVGGLDMLHRLAGRGRAVVAADTVAGDAAVIEDR